MGENTKIEWCDHSFNAVVGCTKVSDACQNCYAESWAKRAGKPELWTGERRRTSPANWKQPIKWNAKAKADGVRRRVFCCSLADVFDNQWDPQWRADLWELIAQCDSLDWLLLTKRPQNIAKMLPPDDLMRFPTWPWRHVWLGTTAENQEEYDRRWPHLAHVNAAVRFLSCEPLLGPITLDKTGPYADWLITGGESGPNARPTHPDWLRSLRNQCSTNDIPLHHKQNGEWIGYGAAALPDHAGNLGLPCKPKSEHKWPDGSYAFRVGKKAAGRLLDGVEHNGFPLVEALL